MKIKSNDALRHPADLTKPLPITMATGAVVQQAEPVDVKDGWFSVPWRLLSVGAFWMNSSIGPVFVEYTEDVLKAALDAGVYNRFRLASMHDDDIREWLGKVDSPVWRDAEGNIPAGINAMVHVSEQRDTELKTGQILGIKEKIITNGSMGQDLQLKPSHKFDDEWTFWEMMGREVDGELVRLIATKVVRANEFSTVDIPADKNATLQTQLSKGAENMEVRKELEAVWAALGHTDTTKASVTQATAEIKVLRAKAAEHDKHIEAIRTAAKADLAALKDAKVEVNAGYADMVESTDTKVLQFVAAELRAKLDAQIPDTRVSKQTVNATEDKPVTPTGPTYDNPEGY